MVLVSAAFGLRWLLSDTPGMSILKSTGMAGYTPDGANRTFYLETEAGTDFLFGVTYEDEVRWRVAPASGSTMLDVQRELDSAAKRVSPATTASRFEETAGSCAAGAVGSPSSTTVAATTSPRSVPNPPPDPVSSSTPPGCPAPSACPAPPPDSPVPTVPPALAVPNPSSHAITAADMAAITDAMAVETLDHCVVGNTFAGLMASTPAEEAAKDAYVGAFAATVRATARLAPEVIATSGSRQTPGLEASLGSIAGRLEAELAKGAGAFGRLQSTMDMDDFDLLLEARYLMQTDCD